MKFAEKLVALDHIFPPRGPCGICGGPDARHRLWDVAEGQARTSDGPEGAARWLWLPEMDVRALVDAFAHARRLHRPLPGRYPLPEAA